MPLICWIQKRIEKRRKDKKNGLDTFIFYTHVQVDLLFLNPELDGMNKNKACCEEIKKKKQNWQMIRKENSK